MLFLQSLISPRTLLFCTRWCGKSTPLEKNSRSRTNFLPEKRCHKKWIHRIMCKSLEEFFQSFFRTIRCGLRSPVFLARRPNEWTTLQKAESVRERRNKHVASDDLRLVCSYHPAKCQVPTLKSREYYITGNILLSTVVRPACH